MAQNYILDVLLENGLITRDQLEQARRERREDATILDALIELGAVTQEEVTRSIAAHASMDFVEIADLKITDETLALVSRDLVRRFKVIPICETESSLVLATTDPFNFEAFDSLNHKLRRELEFVCVTEADMKAALLKYYGDIFDAIQDLEVKIKPDGALGDDGRKLVEQESADGPVIQLVSSMLLEAHALHASDIHIEPLEKRLRVRFRIDGVLHEMKSQSATLQAAIISRLKIMTGSMQIAEKRLPQDGRIQVKVNAKGKTTGKQIDLRVSTIPTNHGESVVMRILDKSSLSLGLPQLGFLSDDQEVFERLITLPDGILLVTGPTGSGKTTTLYGCLNYINRPDKKLITVEDPVEYQMNGINQVQVNTDIGMSFPAALRSILRQAPNVIMIGEIRDLETANIAINASLTGHLVFSTLHTNDAPSAVARLVDIGVQPFLVSSAVRAIMAQRLVRKICAHCAEPHEMTEAEMSALGLDPAQAAGAHVMKGRGCERCKHLGYKGRAGIFEIFLIDDESRHMINAKASTIELRRRAREMGMRTLREDGIRKVLSGMTTAEEVISVTMADAN